MKKYFLNVLTRQDGFPITSFFKFVVKEAILVERAHEMLVSLNSVSIPYTFYNIREGVNDTILIQRQASCPVQQCQ